MLKHQTHLTHASPLLPLSLNMMLTSLWFQTVEALSNWDKRPLGTLLAAVLWDAGGALLPAGTAHCWVRVLPAGTAPASPQSTALVADVGLSQRQGNRFSWI